VSFDKRHGFEEHHLAKNLETVIPKGAHIASFKTGQTWALSFYNRYRDYGGIEGEKNKKLAAEIQAYDIRFVLVPQNDLEKTETLLKGFNYLKTAVEAGTWYVLKLK
jgi:V8-like Glu-specific endopeptidase